MTRLTLIGFGEAGATFGAVARDAGATPVAFDRKTGGAEAAAKWADYRAAGIAGEASAAAALADSPAVLCSSPPIRRSPRPRRRRGSSRRARCGST